MLHIENKTKYVNNGLESKSVIILTLMYMFRDFPRLALDFYTHYLTYVLLLHSIEIYIVLYNYFGVFFTKLDILIPPFNDLLNHLDFLNISKSCFKFMTLSVKFRSTYLMIWRTALSKDITNNNLMI